MALTMRQILALTLLQDNALSPIGQRPQRQGRLHNYNSSAVTDHICFNEYGSVLSTPVRSCACSLRCKLQTWDSVCITAHRKV